MNSRSQEVSSNSQPQAGLPSVRVVPHPWRISSMGAHCHARQNLFLCPPSCRALCACWALLKAEVFSSHSKVLLVLHFGLTVVSLPPLSAQGSPSCPPACPAGTSAAISRKSCPRGKNMRSFFPGFFGVVEDIWSGWGRRPLSLCCAANCVASLFVLPTESTDSFVSSKCRLAFWILWLVCFCGFPFSSVIYIAKGRKPEAGWWRLHTALASLCVSMIVGELVTSSIISGDQEMFICL